MGSSNRHWPSFFKSNLPSSAPHHQQRHHDINRSSQLGSCHCQKPCSYTSGAEEKTPEPKPRWNPKPEQIRILESIFNSGMVNPPRDEICRIRDQLQVYGQVGDANVFYWFQNRKSRSKHKQRHLKFPAARTKPCSAAAVPFTSPIPPPPSTTTSSSSSSDLSSSGSDKLVLPAFLNLPESLAPPLLNPELGLGASAFLPGISSYPTPSGELADGSIDPGIPSLWSGLIMQGFSRKNDFGDEFGMLAVLGSVADFALLPSAPIASNYMASAMAAPSSFNEIEAARSTVFINEVAYEVMARPLNIREAFGENTVLVHSSGHPVLTDPVLTDERGLTLHPLQHGSSYYLVQ